METQGKYKDLYPIGAVIHYTASKARHEKDAEYITKLAQQRGHCYFVIGPTGKVYQSFPLTDWGYHAGPSEYPGLGKGLSTKLVGIEVCCAGKLCESRDGLMSWFGDRVKEEDARMLQVKREGATIGWYQKYKETQEKALIELIQWLKANNPKAFQFENVLGHSEIAPGRKSDPGGSLSMSMSEFRALLSQK
jgi:N-acetylmuramoyl-L-alanine amidase